MEDVVRDFVVNTWGPLYVIGGIITVGAFTAAFAWKIKDQEFELAIFLGLCAVGIAALALSGLPIAKADCKAAYMQESPQEREIHIGPYFDHN